MIGVDVSTHNGVLNDKLFNQVDFLIIRVGYGKNNIDKQAKNNIEKCIEKNKKFGVYWFSYAYTPEMAKNEAKYCIDFISNFAVEPIFIAYDFEYDSDRYANSKGIYLTNNDRYNLAINFLSYVENSNYLPLLYSNKDYLNKGFKNILSYYYLWEANWSKKPNLNEKCVLWQFTDKYEINNKLYDGNMIIDENIFNIKFNRTPQEYLQAAIDVLNGKYSTNEERKELLKNNGFYPDKVQSLVNTAVLM